jgi:RNA polymerase sigma factor (sigma-70 family)
MAWLWISREGWSVEEGEFASADAEARVIRRAQQRDLAAFNALVLAHQGLAYSVAKRILGSRESAADATQESFLQAYRTLGRFRGGSFRAWLLRVVVNTCYDTLRFQRRHPNSSLGADGAANEHAIRLHAGAESAEESAILHELNGRIQAALGRLPVDQRVVVILCDIEGLTYDEIVASTGMQLETVKSRLCRGRVRLRNLLQVEAEPTDWRE